MLNDAMEIFLEFQFVVGPLHRTDHDCTKECVGKLRDFRRTEEDVVLFVLAETDYVMHLRKPG